MGFDLGISGVGSDRSANCATTTAHFLKKTTITLEWCTRQEQEKKSFFKTALHLTLFPSLATHLWLILKWSNTNSPKKCLLELPENT